ncbi:hypothetical protein RhiirC2_709653 [Rhizophagus irregularis]|uniref:Uncharacterized protein n=1 Tax=Rhizophagus irregularis TaxID=588596 RepID=A0A2N1NHT5_9GLOM|nr:hypothetical protein RhiirC2_709653 [Rhizophagus irregularis]
MSAITTKFVKDHNLTDASEVSIEELSQHALEILNFLTSGDPLVDREKRRQACVHLQKGYKYNKEQVFALIPDQRIERHIRQLIPKEGKSASGKVNICQEFDSTCSEEIIKETTQCIVWNNLSERDVKAISRTLVETASDPVVTLSRLSRF